MGITRAVSAPVGRAGFVALGVTMLLAGCGSGGAQGRQTGAAASPVSATATNPVPSPVPSPVSSVQPSAPGSYRATGSPRGASHATGPAACRDADCEVQVRPGDRLKIDSRFGLDAITVESVSAGEVRLGITGSSGGLNVDGDNVSVTGSCTNGRCHDQGQMSLTTSRPGRINDIRLRLVKADSSRAVLVLTPE
ncbi:hypothetical protein [Microtetraspora glauca]|uniref:DUF3060 domain-containing protein n=1 Tax=Microtetraspora glauca TaxID=1996 RepID=A0ABV3GNH6_MICGL